MSTLKNETYSCGLKKIVVEDDQLNISFPALVQYPTLTPTGFTNFGPYRFEGRLDAEIAEGSFPMVLISHGNGGSHLIYRTISSFLAKHGFIVVMPEHYGNNRRDNSIGDAILNLQLRPKHLSLTIDHMISNVFPGKIDIERIGIVGHSFGGYTAMVLAGGEPWTKDKIKVKVEADERVAAIVLMAPAAGYFIPDEALSKVNIPVLLLIGEQDRITPKKYTEDIIRKGIKNQQLLTCKTIPNAGHFSFITPFPDVLNKPGFIPASDPVGFDRNHFHTYLPIDIFKFLNSKLGRN